MKNNLLAVGGALLGGLVGYFLFFWVAAQGFYALVLPGGLLGLGAGITKNRSISVPVTCGLLAAALGVFTEFRFAPFRADDSFGYFLTHLPDLKPITLVMIAAGGAIAFYVPFRRREQTPSS